MVKHKNAEKVISLNLRLPVSLHKTLAKKAVKERRSLNEQIVYTLERDSVKPARKPAED